MDKEQNPPEIIEAYRDYSPPVNVKGIISRMLKTVPMQYLSGLDAIVLKNSHGMSREERRKKSRSRKKRVRLSGANGYYRKKWNGRGASIVLLVDNICEGLPPRVLRAPFFLDMAFDTLYHEIGHHIHYTIKPEYKEREDVADIWEHRLLKHHMRKKYWYLAILLAPFFFLSSITRKRRRPIKEANN